MTLTRENRVVQPDANGRPAAEVATLDGEAIRVTWIPETPGIPSWAGEPRVRINKVQVNGHVVPGPEVPQSCVPDFVHVLVQLLLEIVPGTTA